MRFWHCRRRNGFTRLGFAAQKKNRERKIRKSMDILLSRLDHDHSTALLQLMILFMSEEAIDSAFLEIGIQSMVDRKTIPQRIIFRVIVRDFQNHHTHHRKKDTSTYGHLSVKIVI